MGGNWGELGCSAPPYPTLCIPHILTWSDGDHPDAERRQVAGDGQRHAHDAALGG